MRLSQASALLMLATTPWRTACPLSVVNVRDAVVAVSPDEVCFSALHIPIQSRESWSEYTTSSRATHP